MSILAEHLFTRDAIERRREAIEAAVDEAIAEYRRELKALLRRQHRSLKLRPLTVSGE